MQTFVDQREQGGSAPKHDSDRAPRRDVARVFFSYDGDRLVAMRGLPLRNHLNNVALLAEQWDMAAAFGAGEGNAGASADVADMSDLRREWLVEAARRHDLGKPRRFRVTQDDRRLGRYSYSFRGHRFDVEDERPYVQQLIRLHHSFSVTDVTEAQAMLQSRADAPEVVAAARYFPLDLYALEMCDQIEAEATTYAFDQPEERQRVFMEFETYPERESAGGNPDALLRLRLFPYPFREPEIHLSIESFIVQALGDAPQTCESLKRLLVSAGDPEPQPPCEVILCPLQ